MDNMIFSLGRASVLAGIIVSLFEGTQIEGFTVLLTSSKCCSSRNRFDISTKLSATNADDETLFPDAQKSKNSARYGDAPLIDRRGGFLYRKSVFDKEELEIISREVALYATERHLREETSSSIALNRLGVALPNDSKTVQILRNGSLVRWINHVARSKSRNDDRQAQYELRSELPVEVRVYEKTGASMAWHYDDVLFDPPQLEVIWTLENTSDCATLCKGDNERVHAIETERNAAILLRAGKEGPEHCVTSLKRGRRVILKCVYALQNAVLVCQEAGTPGGQLDNQFGKASSMTGSKSSKRKKRRRKR